MYFITSPYSISWTDHQLLSFSTECLLKEVDCLSPVAVSGLPEIFPPVNWVSLSWAPNGKYAFYVNWATDDTENRHEAIMLFEPKTQTSRTIGEYKEIRDGLWNPDSSGAAFCVKRLDNGENEIIFVTPDGGIQSLPIIPAQEAGYTPFIFNGQVFDMNQYPLTWINEKELIFIRQRGEFFEIPDTVPVLPVDHLFRFNVETSIETEIEIPANTGVYFTDGNVVIYRSVSSGSKTVYNLETKQEISLNDSDPISFSPNGKWMILVESGESTYFASVDTKIRHKIIDDTPLHTVWLPDNEHVILLVVTKWSKHIPVEYKWYVASISEQKIREISGTVHD